MSARRRRLHAAAERARIVERAKTFPGEAEALIVRARVTELMGPRCPEHVAAAEVAYEIARERGVGLPTARQIVALALHAYPKETPDD